MCQYWMVSFGTVFIQNFTTAGKSAFILLLLVSDTATDGSGHTQLVTSAVSYTNDRSIFISVTTLITDYDMAFR
jgi:hypothetical protein